MSYVLLFLIYFSKKGNKVQDVSFLGVLLDRIFADIQTSAAFQVRREREGGKEVLFIDLFIYLGGYS